jgi:hypothetical protein
MFLGPPGSCDRECITCNFNLSGSICVSLADAHERSDNTSSITRRRRVPKGIPIDRPRNLRSKSPMLPLRDSGHVIST